MKKSIVYLGKCGKCNSFLNLVIKMNVEVKAPADHIQCYHCHEPKQKIVPYKQEFESVTKGKKNGQPK